MSEQDHATKQALRRWGFPEDADDPNFGERAIAAVRAVDAAHGVLYAEQLELLSTLSFQDDPRRVGAFYFGLMMQAADFIVSDAASGGRA